MGLWEMIVCVVALGVVAQIIMAYLKSREVGAVGGNDLAKHLDRIDRLEERIKVLERIATDKRDNLKEEIDRL